MWKGQGVLDTPAALEALGARLVKAGRVAVDTEFHGEKFYLPRMMLLQLATAEEIAIVDPLGADPKPLLEQLCGADVCLVGHALKNDLAIFARRYGCLPLRVFDTQVAAAFLGLGHQIGLGNLLHAELGIALEKSKTLADWSKRPLADGLLRYASDDVAFLLDLAARLETRLEERGRLVVVRAECAKLVDPAFYAPDLDNAWRKVAGGRRLPAKEAGVLRALVVERDAIAAQLDRPVGWIVPDDLLLDLALRAPRKRADLEGSMRRRSGAIDQHAGRWIAAIDRGLATPVGKAPSRPPPTDDMEAVSTLAMLLVGRIAKHNEIAPPMLCPRDALMDVVRAMPATQLELEQRLGLDGWRAQILGEPLWRLLCGELRVGVEPNGGSPRLAWR